MNNKHIPQGGMGDFAQGIFLSVDDNMMGIDFDLALKKS